MKKFLLFILSILLYSNILASGLSSGDIMFVGFNIDDDDNLAFLALVNIPNGTIIYFTDNEWNGLDIGSGGDWNDTNEGFNSWTNNTGSDILAGSVIFLNDFDGNPDPSTDCGIISNGAGSFNMGGTNEVVYVYCGSDETTPTTFLTALGTDEFSSAVGTLDGTGLVAGTNATAIDGDEDIGVFIGPITGSTTAANIADPNNWATQDGSGSQSGDGTYPDWPDDVPGGTANCNLPLPISLDKFEVASIEEKIIKLTWQTHSEVNNDYFSIEHSTGGTSFREVMQQVGAGTTNIRQSYSFLHEDLENGIHYYRLKQVDFDGKYEYSNIKTATIKHSDNDIFLTPNPTSNVILIQTKISFENDADFQILNMQGQVVLSGILPEGNNEVDLNISDFPIGIYYFRLFVDNDVIMKKIIKQ